MGRYNMPLHVLLMTIDDHGSQFGRDWTADSLCNLRIVKCSAENGLGMRVGS
jgi:hypothetical protein